MRSGHARYRFVRSELPGQVNGRKGGVRNLVAVIGVLLTLVGCTEGDEDSSDGASGAQSAAKAGLIWASGSVVHLADGTTIDTGESIAAYVVAGDGVYFVTDESPDTPSFTGAMEAELHVADRDGTVTDTGVTILVSTLTASPSGRYVAALDMGAVEDGERAETVVWDVDDGGEVIRADDGMGDPDDDLEWLYSEVSLDIPLLTDEEVYVDGVEEVWSYDLGTGDGTQLDEDAEVPAYDVSSRVSPDGGWQITGDPERPIGVDEHNQTITSPSGKVWEPSVPTESWQLLGWVDEDTVYGVAHGDATALLTCEVDRRACRVLDESAGQSVQFPIDELSYDGLDLGELGRLAN